MPLPLTILVTALVFGVIITIHELGHFLCAKMFGVKVNEFAFGMGPALKTWKKGETKYALRVFPIGGYVLMEGEDEDSHEPRALCNKPVWQRMIILSAGAILNILLGFLILLIVTLSPNHLIGSNIVGGFYPDATVAPQYLQPGDRIIRINNYPTPTFEDARFHLALDEDGIIDLVIKRDNEKIQLDGIQFPMEEVEGGARVLTIDFKFLALEKTPLTVIGSALGSTAANVRQVWYSLLFMITGRFNVSELSGPVGTAVVIGKVGGMGILYLLELIALITINIGVFNLLPLPALDGGRLIFIVVEAIRGKAINPEYEGYIHAAGLVFFLALILFVTYNDIVKALTHTFGG